MWDYLVLGLLLALNAGCVALVAMQLPGTWVMLVLTALVAWWRAGHGSIAWWVIVIMALLALAGEALEFLGGLAGARRSGGSKRAAAGAVVGAVLGAILGTMLIPVPVLGTIWGACLGAGLLATVGDRWAGRSWDASLQTGHGAMVGRVVGTAAKLAVAVAMWLTSAVSVLWP